MEEYWIWLSSLPYVGAVTQKKLLAVFKNPEHIYEASESELKEVKGVSRRAIESILFHRSLEKSKRILKNVHKKQIKLLTYNDEKYPEKIKTIRESPALLYFVGELHPYNEAVAVIGSRRCTSYGKTVASELAAELAKQNVPVVSGLAKGIDGYAHTACIQKNGYTIAFVASGVDICYPKEHQPLYEQIKESGAILSSYPPGTKPNPKQFLERNGLISAWASKVVIVEAGERSGALTTADFATKQGKQLFAVPHLIHSEAGKGTNKLLAQGAAPYLDFSSLGLPLIKHLFNLSEYQQPTVENVQMLDELSEGPCSVQMLAHKLQLTEKAVREQLFNLELEGKVFVRADIVSLI